MNTYRWGGPHYYPITIAQYGLAQYGSYIETDEPRFLDRAQHVAQWFVENQDSRGGWPVTFEHEFFPGRTAPLSPPWYSALAQGQAMSFLARMYRVTDQGRYRHAIERAGWLFYVLVKEGGVLREWNGHLVFEEYPTEPPSFVLNGFMSALLGLYDAHQATGESLMLDRFSRGIDTLD